MKGEMIAGLPGGGVFLQRAHHHAVEGERRVDVDQRGHHAVLVDHIRAEEDLRHLDAVGGA
jgi:hypothetical protein